VFIKRIAAAAIVSAVSVIGIAPAAHADSATTETKIVKVKPGIIDWDVTKPVTPRIIDWDSNKPVVQRAIDWD